MKFLKNFNQFINEGAYLDDNGNVILSAKDDRENKDEVLKSSSGGVKWFKDVGLPGRSPGKFIFPKFFSLGTSDYEGPIDHPGRFKYTMDQLKAANIVDLESSLPEFIKYSLSQIGVTSNFIPNYLVAVGSTKGLVAELCDAIKKAIGRDIPVISLPKVKYLNAGDAINWDEIRFQMKSQASPTNPGGINTLNIAKNNILNYIRRNVRGQAADPYATMDDLVKAIRNATSLEELESLISGKGRYISPDTEVKWKPQINGETMLPFIVRSSGRNAGGTRSFWKRKYNYDDSQFLEAAIDCVKSVHENPLKPKKMLIVDDNINTGQDTRDIRSNIEDVIKGIYESPTDRKRRAAEMQFGFYVLYDMKPALDLEYTIAGDPKKYNKFPVSSAEADAFATLKNLPPL